MQQYPIELEKNVGKMLNKIQFSNISADGLFLNADAGFDTEEFRKFCYINNIIDNIDMNSRNGKENDHIFDELFYKCRFIIEKTKAWLDAFKALLVRFETN